MRVARVSPARALVSNLRERDFQDRNFEIYRLHDCPRRRGFDGFLSIDSAARCTEAPHPKPDRPPRR